MGMELDGILDSMREYTKKVNELEKKVGLETDTIQSLVARLNGIEERTRPDVYVFDGKKYYWEPTTDKPLRFVEVKDGGD